MVWVALCGFFTFMPIGLAFLGLLLLNLGLLLQRSQWAARWAQLRPWAWLLLLPLLWALLVLLVQGWHAESATRLFHLVRVSWVIALGLLLMPHERWYALYGLVAGALYACALLWAAQVWALPDISPFRPFLTVTGNASSQKMIMLAATAAVALLMALQSSPRQRLLWAALALLCAATVAALSVSRNAHLLLLALPLLLLLSLYRRRWQPLLAGALALLALAALALQFSPTVAPRLEQAQAELSAFIHTGAIGTSVGVRAQMYLVAARGMIEQPLFGTGLGSWNAHWYAFAAPIHPEMAGINNPHNDFLLTGMETGVPGLLLLLALLGALGWRSWRARDTLGHAGLLLWGTVLVTALVNAPFRDAVLGLSMVWLMALLAQGSAGAKNHPD